uniref:Linear gramicidin synthase subunit D n=1 Tax=Parastrongyloides trichosuri TaxID=131310 RepID=A0A0N5A110_PARTI
MDEAGFQLQLLGQGAGVDDAELAAVAVFVIQAFAQHAGRGLAVDVVPVVDPITRRQVDLAAQERTGEVAADRVPAAVAVVVVILGAQGLSVRADPAQRTGAVGVAHGDAVAQGHAPGAVALALGELIGAAEQVLAALEQIGVEGGDVLAADRVLQNDVGDDGIALHLDARRPAPDQFDTLDLAGHGARQDVGAGVVLGSRARAVDQDVADRAFKAARPVAVVDRETGHPVDHVQRRVGAGVDEEVRGEDQHGLIAGDGRLAGGGVGLLGGQGDGRRGGAQQQGGGGQQGAFGVHFSSPSVSSCSHRPIDFSGAVRRAGFGSGRPEPERGADPSGRGGGHCAAGGRADVDDQARRRRGDGSGRRDRGGAARVRMAAAGAGGGGGPRRPHPVPSTGPCFACRRAAVDVAHPHYRLAAGGDDDGRLPDARGSGAARGPDDGGKDRPVAALQPVAAGH